MRETRVNLKHLLEDIRDSYTISLEEIILAELVANALDCGAGSISFFIDQPNNTITCVDNGKGMRRDVWQNIGDKVMMLFDYGDDWRFIVELRCFGEKSSKITYPRFIKQVGKAPQQYPDYE